MYRLHNYTSSTSLLVPAYLWNWISTQHGMFCRALDEQTELKIFQDASTPEQQGQDDYHGNAKEEQQPMPSDAVPLALPGSPTPKSKPKNQRLKKPPPSPSPITFRSARLRQKHEQTLARHDNSSQSKIAGLSTASPVSAIRIKSLPPKSTSRNDPQDTVSSPPKLRAQSKGESPTECSGLL